MPRAVSSQSETGFKILLSLACVVVIVAGARAASGMLIPIILGLFLAGSTRGASAGCGDFDNSI